MINLLIRIITFHTMFLSPTVPNIVGIWTDYFGIRISIELAVLNRIIN